MNKAFSKIVEQAALKHEKKSEYTNRHCFKAGAEYCDKKSPKQYTKKAMYQMLYDGIGHFALENKITIDTGELNRWFKAYIKAEVISE